jgi:hypothetical protein
MRRLSQFLVPVVAAGVLAATIPAGAASAAPVVQPELFGQHVAGIASGTPGTLPVGTVGAIRLWDAGVTWREVETSDNEYNWVKLDAAVRNARALGAREILYTLGSTPQWAASDPNSKLGLYGPGSNSHPKSNAYYTDFLKVVAARYKGLITAYQAWNEANLRDFYLGTPAQMANLTKDAYIALKSVDPGAKMVAASTTVRAKGPVGKFGKAYGPAMKKVGWKYVDAVSAHFYPPATSGPGTRVAYIKKMKSYYKKYGAGKKPMWDGEMSFGDTRPYMKVKRSYTGDTAATFVARTYVDSMRYGVKRVFWYGWDIHVLGTDLTSRTDGGLTAGGRAFLEVQDWMVNRAWYGCKVKSSITTCTIGSPTGKATIRYASKTKTVKLPAGTWKIRRLDGTSTTVGGGTTIKVNAQPIHIARAA